MKKIKSPLQNIASSRWKLLDGFNRLPRPSKRGVEVKIVAEPIRKGKSLFVLAIITLTSGCSGFHPRVDASGGELLLCVDTSREDRCYKPEPKRAPVEVTDIQG